MPLPIALFPMPPAFCCTGLSCDDGATRTSTDLGEVWLPRALFQACPEGICALGERRGCHTYANVGAPSPPGSSSLYLTPVSLSAAKAHFVPCPPESLAAVLELIASPPLC